MSEIRSLDREAHPFVSLAEAAGRVVDEIVAVLAPEAEEHRRAVREGEVRIAALKACAAETEVRRGL